MTLSAQRHRQMNGIGHIEGVPWKPFMWQRRRQGGAPRRQDSAKKALSGEAVLSTC